jgi:AcrR family transcriptional regulator
VPKLWSDTIEAHRREVQDAVVTTTARLVADEGPWAVTMSRVAEEAGIGRATLYKYFPDVESILLAWHDRQIADHLQQLNDATRRAADPADRLRVVLETYAHIVHQAHGHANNELGALLHRGQRIADAEAELHDMVRDLIATAAEAGAVRTDTPPAELAAYALNSLGAAGTAGSKAAVTRLVRLTLDALRP